MHLGPEFFRGPPVAGGRFWRTEAGLRGPANRSVDAVSDGTDRPHAHAGKSPADLRLSYGRLLRLQLFSRARSALSSEHFPAAGTFLDRFAKARRRNPEREEPGPALDFRR